MKQKRNTLDHSLCLEELHEMEEFIPMTLPERERVRKWVYSGHSVSENPWKYRDRYGFELNYLDAYHKHLECKWGEFYHPFYKVIRTTEERPETYEGECCNEMPFL